MTSTDVTSAAARPGSRNEQEPEVSATDSGTAEPSAVELTGVSKTFSTQVALHPLDLRIADGEFVTLLGPSGCGKTTLLRIIAGLEQSDAGSIRVFGEDVTRRPANKRPVNLVFQRVTLFPHLTVAQNVAFGPRLQRTGKTETEKRVQDALELVRLGDFGGRRVTELSGGQAQRIALARALANQPRVLLLDEPLSALDLQIRRQMQVELKDIHRRLGLTFIYVTHDQEEAMSMSDRVIIMRDGRAEQSGSPVEIYRNPRSPFVARFLGMSNVVQGRAVSVDADSVVLRDGELDLTAARPAFPVEQGADVSCVVRPDVIEILPAASAAAGDLRGAVGDVRFVGSVVHYRVRSAAHDWQVSVRSGDSRIFAEGDQVALRWRPADVTVLPVASEQPE